jgi:[protein-PII] uridylyltransferase
VTATSATGSDRAVARMTDELAALDRAYSPGHHGRWSANRRADIVDACVVALFAAAPPGVALAAIGGYGRRLQLPGSDVDLLFVHDGSRPDDVAQVVERVLYPLWDAGVAIGQAVRTPEGCLAVAVGRTDAATAMLDVRALAGDGRVMDDAIARVLAWVREDVPGFALRLREAAEERRERYGSTAHLLEPDVKEGAGGLRDIASIGWLERAAGELARPQERETLGAAEEFMVRARSAMHLETAKRTDRLFGDLQPAVAREMGFADEPRLTAVDGLMRSLFEHARQVEHVVGAVFDRLLSGGDAGATVRPDDAREALLGAIRAGEGGVPTLEALDRDGSLAGVLQGWADVRCRPQRDPYHRFTVDVHLVQAFAGMARMLDGDEAPDPIAVEAVTQVTDREGALLGALLHDIGKNGEGGHVEEGARVARIALDGLGVTGPSRDLALFMVEHHLLLPDTATRRDLGDDDLILDVAATIGTPERLAALYLLAIADAAATGPAAWTPWRQTLIRELVAKVQRTFDRGDMGVEVAERLTEQIDRLRELLEDRPAADVDRFVLRMPMSYFLTVEPAQAARHFAAIAPELGTLEVRTTTTEGVRPGSYELLVVAADRPGLLSWIAGALTLAGLSILTAQVFTTDDGAAVDLFEVEGAFEPVIGEERWREFRAMLRKAIEGRVSLDRRVADKRGHYPAPVREVPLTVAVDNAASDVFTVIEIGAADRIGLLYDVTRALAELELDVHLAKIATYADRVIDAFYVRDPLGRKLDDDARTKEIEAVVRARLAPPAPATT